jgi:hypothetical protein
VEKETTYALAEEEPAEEEYICPFMDGKPCLVETCNVAHFELGCFFPEMVNYMDSQGKQNQRLIDALERIADALEHMSGKGRDWP